MSVVTYALPAGRLPARALYALLWESWMTIRWGFLSRLAVALATMALFCALFETRDHPQESDADGFKIALWSIAFLCMLSGLNVGARQDGTYGFPFNLGFWRPVPTWVQVIVPMGCQCAAITALYLIPMLVADWFYDEPTLLLAATLVLVPIVLMAIANSWWSAKEGINQIIGWSVLCLISFALFYYCLHINENYGQSEAARKTWFWSFSFTFRDYLLILLASVSAIVLALAGVEGQRHGDDVLWSRRSGEADGEDWLAELYETECPTSSRRRAELWSEITGQGVPTIVWCASAALLLPSLWLFSNLVDSPFFLGCVTIVIGCLPLAKGTPSFGMRLRQGNAYLSTFDATRPLTTASIAAVKLGVGIVSLLIGAGLVAASAWFSTPLLDNFAVAPITFKLFILDYVAALTTLELSVQLFVWLVQIASAVAFLAAIQAAYAVYGNVVTITVMVLLVYPSVPPILIATKVMPLWVGIAHVWLAAAVVVAGAVYLLGSLARNRILTAGQVLGLLAAFAGYALAYFHRAGQEGLFDADTPTVFLVFRIGACIASLAAFAFAPWALAKARNG